MMKGCFALNVGYHIVLGDMAMRSILHVVCMLWNACRPYQDNSDDESINMLLFKPTHEEGAVNSVTVHWVI